MRLRSETLLSLPLLLALSALFPAGALAQAPQLQLTAASNAAVTAVAFSPDGRLLACANTNHTVKLWNLATGRRNRTLSGHAGPVTAVAFSPDGALLATASRDRTIRLWDVATGRTLSTLTGHADAVLSIAFDVGGRLLASGGADREVRVWDVAARAHVRSFAGHAGGVFAVAFARAEPTLSSASPDSVRLWNVTTGGNPTTLKELSGAYTAFALSGDGRLLAAGTSTGIKVRRVSGEPDARVLRGHAAQVTALAFAPDGETLLSGDSAGALRRWSLYASPGSPLAPTESPAPEPVTAPVASLAYGRAGKLFALGTGPAAELRTQSRGSVLARLLAPNEKEWVVVTPDGHYDGTAGGMTYVRLRQGELSLQIDAFFERLYTPKLLGQVVEFGEGLRVDRSGFGGLLQNPTGGAPSVPREIYARPGTLLSRESAGISLTRPVQGPPVVRLDVSQGAPTLKRAEPPAGGRGIASELQSLEAAKLTVNATDQGGGVAEIRVYQNGKLVVEDVLAGARPPGAAQARGLGLPGLRPGGAQNAAPGVTGLGQNVTRTYDVLLAPGGNVFRAVALNLDRTESNPAEVTVAGTLAAGARPTTDLYVVAVGLNEYRNPKYNLNFGRADAAAFAGELERRGRGIFRRIDKQLITDAGATRESVEAAFARVAAAAQPGDAFVFYFAGHGAMSEGADAGAPAQFYLVPHDVTQIYGNDEGLAAKGISAAQLKEWSRRVPAQKQLIVLDACQAGGAVDVFASVRGVPEEKAIMQLARSVGIIIIAATGTEQVAAEFPTLGHGAFTYALLQGLSGQADGGSQPDGKITVKELEAFLNDTVPELTRRFRGQPQFPNSYSRGQDFPLGVK